MNIIDYHKNLAQQNKNKIEVELVANVDGVTNHTDDYALNSVASEYLNEIEVDELNRALKHNGFKTNLFYSEIEFIEKFLLSKKSLNKKVVLNIAQQGTHIGRKSLIPAFCELNSLSYTSSNPYVVSLCRDKYHSGILLKYHGINVPKSWIYKSDGWFMDKEPEEQEKVIIKLNNESASIGIDENNIIYYSSKQRELLNYLNKVYKQDLIVQEFIEGYEIEVPFIHAQTPYCLHPVGIKIENEALLNSKILTYNLRGQDNYEFYNFNEFSVAHIENIKIATQKIATILNIKGFGRVDYRIKKNGDFYVTDIATSPHIVKHSSFHFSFKNLNYSYQDMIATLIGLTLAK